MRTYDRPIEIFKQDESTEQYTLWDKCPKLHAYVNKSKDKEEYLSGEATQHQINLAFEVRYNSALKEIFDSPQLFRIRFEGVYFDIVDVDDYQLRHMTLKMLGVSVNGN